MPVAVKLTMDFICPWCLIGEARLRNAIGALPEEVDVEIEWLPFELNPLVPRQGMARNLYRTNKFGNLQRSNELDAQTIAASKDDGVVIDYDRIFKTPNSFAAHRLSWFAAREGRQRAIVDGLLKGYFGEGHDIGDHEVLIELAAAAGFERETVREFLESKIGARKVRALEAEAKNAGIQAVPHFDIEGSMIVGAAESEAMREALIDAYDRKEGQRA